MENRGMSKFLVILQDLNREDLVRYAGADTRPAPALLLRRCRFLFAKREV